MKIEFSQHIFEKYSNMTFPENLCTESQVFSMQVDKQLDMTKLIVPFHNLGNVSNKKGII